MISRIDSDVSISKWHEHFIIQISEIVNIIKIVEEKETNISRPKKIIII